MDQSLLRLTLHLAEARGGQAPLVADAFNTACPKNINQAAVNVNGAWSGAVNLMSLSYVLYKVYEYIYDILCGCVWLLLLSSGKEIMWKWIMTTEDPKHRATVNIVIP